MNPRRLYRSTRDRKLAGIAAGMADYFDLDPTLVRILWIVSVFFGGFSILLYIILAFVIPVEPAMMPGPGSWQPAGAAWGAPRSGPAWGAPPSGPAWGAPPSGPLWGASPTQAAGVDSAGIGSPAAGSPAAGSEAAGSEAAATEGAQASGEGASTGEGQSMGGVGGAAPYGWTAPAPDQRPISQGGGRAGLYLGILLVVFGAMALAGTMFPAWIGARHLGPALIVAVGVLLLVASIRRDAFGR